MPDASFEILHKLAALINGQHCRAGTPQARYNVFTTLFRHDHEVGLHTRFLKDLLDPDGNHGCGGMFLNLFFEVIGRADLVSDTGRTSQWSVRREVRCGDSGNIDLMIMRPGLTIAIENKTRLLEQPEQLKRYAEYLKENHASSVLLFLTPHGSESTTAFGREYTPISYANHILQWLQKCRVATAHDTYSSVHEILRQYIEVVRQLIGDTPYTRMIESAASFALEHPDLIRNRAMIIDALERAKIKALMKIASDLKEAIGPFALRQGADGAASFYECADGVLDVTDDNGSPLGGEAFRVRIQNWTEKRWLILGIETSNANAETYKGWFTELSPKLGAGFAKSGGYSTWPIGWLKLDEKFDDARIAELIQPNGEVQKLGSVLKKAISAVADGISNMPPLPPIPPQNVG